ncbi:unnamed protein product [Spirodela intermedia]|uniref:Uncharacterized protein n=1 Tax=Spirodela intermedia TaxID=51605 RepID=A0A7I8L8C9_SPIIN|nr:unnamed protein product [Spirodela intermedia]
MRTYLTLKPKFSCSRRDTRLTHPEGEGEERRREALNERVHLGWMEVRRVLGSFILRSAQQEEALHRIWYALRSCHRVE